MYVYQWESAPTSAARSTHAVMYEKRLYPYPFPISQEDKQSKENVLWDADAIMENEAVGTK